MKRIFLIAIGLSVVLLADFSKTGYIVTDTTTGLQWQDNETPYKTWTESIDYCEALSLDGHDDWRLPNIKELTSLVDDSKPGLAISDVFQYTGTSEVYWSSTTSVSNSGHAWRVDFVNGYQSINNKGGSCYLRCVRAGQ